MNNKKVQKEINDLYKKLNIKQTKHKSEKSFYDYKLKTKFPTKFVNGNISITNYTK